MPKNAEISWNQKGWCNESTKLQFQWIFNTENFDALKNATNQPKSSAEHGYMCPRGILWSTSSDTHQVVEIYKETST